MKEEFKPGIAYPLPVPDSVDKKLVLYGMTISTGETSWANEILESFDTHWCIPIMPEIPKPKTQEELDSDYTFNLARALSFAVNSTGDRLGMIRTALIQTINYARK